MMLGAIFADVVSRYPQNTALVYRDQEITYKDLFGKAQDLILTTPFSSLPYVVLSGDRTLDEYIGIVSCWISGKPYIPLNPKFSESRCQQILSQLDNAPPEKLDGLAYIIFTSGTTGAPKGVPIRQSQVAQYALAMQKNIYPTARDVMLQIHDFSFDYSVMELVLAWTNGAKLIHVPNDKVVMAPRYVQDNDVTIWMSVPSLASMGYRLGMLPPNSLPSLRVSIFSGEALNYETIRQFSLAAPNSKLLNLHGITEATVTDTYFEVDRDMLAEETPQNTSYQVIPMGWPHFGVEMGLFKPDSTEPTVGVGELCISGKQVTDGYLNNPDLNIQRFFDFDGKRWLRTGDLAEYSEEHGYCYRGRADRQIKFKGYRIELQDIESALRAVSKSDLVCAIPYPVSEDGTIEGLVGVVGRLPVGDLNVDQILDALPNILPSYMVPAKVLMIDEMPLSINGKVDFKAVQDWVKDRLT
jgi:non-ribosomal peptide synthetase component F